MKKHTHIYEVSGNFLHSANMVGNSSLSLETMVNKYNSEGRFKIEFGPIHRTKKGDIVVGIFKDPSPGYINIIYRPRNVPPYEVGGECFRHSMRPIILDFADILRFRSKESKQAVQFCKNWEKWLAAHEQMLVQLSPSSDIETLKEFYYQTLQTHDALIQHLYGGT